MSKPSLPIQVIHGSILDAEAQVIVNAANSYGLMGGGVAGVIRRAAGVEVETEARKHAPVAVGQAVLTSGGKTKFEGIIHAPTMPEPAMRILPKNVGLATRAALRLADENGFSSIAFPGMGTGVGGVAVVEAAAMMIDEIRKFSGSSLEGVVLMDIDPSMIQSWRSYL